MTCAQPMLLLHEGGIYTRITVYLLHAPENWKRKLKLTVCKAFRPTDWLILWDASIHKLAYGCVAWSWQTFFLSAGIRQGSVFQALSAFNTTPSFCVRGKRTTLRWKGIGKWSIVCGNSKHNWILRFWMLKGILCWASDKLLSSEYR